MSSYQKSLSQDAKVEGGYSAIFVNLKFTASEGYQSVKAGVQSFNYVYVSSVAKCISYRVSSKPGFKLAAGFIDQVMVLKETQHKKPSQHRGSIKLTSTLVVKGHLWAPTLHRISH